MKKVLFILLMVSSIHMSAQENMTAQDWQYDLRFLQETIHESFASLFKKIKPEEFDRAVDSLFVQIPTLEDHEIVVGFARIISLFKYGHTDISFNRPNATFRKIPLQIYLFSDGAYITGTHKKYKKALGAKIIGIEGIEIKEIFKKIEPVVPIENSSYFKAYGISYALIPEVLHAQGITSQLKDTVTVKLEKDGKQFDLAISSSTNTRFPVKYGEVIAGKDWLSARDSMHTPLYLEQLERRYILKYLENHNTLYVRYSQVLDDTSESIQRFFKRVFDSVENKKVDKLVLDVRLNSGGNNYNNKQVIKGIIEQRKINKKGKFFVILGRRTFSAAQNLVNELDNYTEAIFVGEPTAENINFFGDSKRLILPKSKLRTYLSFAWWQDKPQWENRDAMAPDIPVSISFEEYHKNQDPVLEKILNYKK